MCVCVCGGGSYWITIPSQVEGHLPANIPNGKVSSPFAGALRDDLGNSIL